MDLRYFEYDHLPPGEGRSVAIRIYEIIRYLDRNLPDGPEKSAGLRKLLEARDCFVRSSLEIHDDGICTVCNGTGYR